MDIMQTSTPYQFQASLSKETLVQEFKSKPVDSLRTPAFIIDRAVFARNCAKMHKKAQAWGAEFRAHVKTHKTAEGTRLQLASEAGRTHTVVVSTLMEAWQIHQSGLIADGTVKDILYGLPVGVNKIQDLSDLGDELNKHGAVVRLLIDHEEHVTALETFEASRQVSKRWSVFVKIDNGYKRAGVVPGSERFVNLVKRALSSSAISLYGFYCHAGNAYGSTSLDEASAFLSSEVDLVNRSAKQAKELMTDIANSVVHQQPFVLSVGSTPTAHAATEETQAKLSSLLHGTLELHAGNYPMLDLQQLHTGLIQQENIAQKVITTVISYYQGRGKEGRDEALCDAGAIAMSKDTGPEPGFGWVIGKPWQLSKISQEHGILLKNDANESFTAELRIGEKVEVVGQHACLTAAAYPWYYVVDSSQTDGEKTVVDVWVPWKGW